MTIDYDTYADGEALLGWLNATIDFQSSEALDSSAVLQALAEAMQRELSGEIAHLNMTLSPDEALAGEDAALSVVRSDIVPELTLRLEEPVSSGLVVVNCRAETDPASLRNALERGLASLKEKFPGGDFR